MTTHPSLTETIYVRLLSTGEDAWRMMLGEATCESGFGFVDARRVELFVVTREN